MTKLQIISRQWSSIYDLLLYIQDKEKAKSLEDIQQDLDIILENSVQQLQELVASVQTLANNMENMVKEQGQQSARLEALESRDGEKWRTVTSYLLTAILGIAVGIIAKQFGL